MANIFGWMSEAERMALRRWACGLDVLELGCYEGVSTLQIARTARSLVSVDTFDGRGTGREQDTLANFQAGLRDSGLGSRVKAYRGLFSEVVPKLGRDFDAVFIDGAHDYENVTSDISLASMVLREDGVLWLHDYCLEHPDVQRAVDQLLATGAVALDQADSLVKLSILPRKNPIKPVKVALAVPHRGGWIHVGCAISAGLFAATHPGSRVMYRGSSLLTANFNELWCQALNARKDGITHFCMLHDDICPQKDFVDVLLAEMAEKQLDCLSVVVPIRDERGLTSTAMAKPDAAHWNVRRLTMKEVYDLPETFTAKDIPYREADETLLLNTGCWIIDICQPWVEGLVFRQQDQISRSRVTGDYLAQTRSEDWDFSRQLEWRGARLGATRKVKVEHEQPHYHNKGPWGTWETDQEYVQRQKEVEENNRWDELRQQLCENAPQKEPLAVAAA